MTDIEIAKSVELEKITKIASKIGINEEDIEQYGSYKVFKINIYIYHFYCGFQFNYLKLYMI